LTDAVICIYVSDSDKYVEPLRGNLIPGFHEVKSAANIAGAYGCTISGAGPTAVAITDSLTKAEAISTAMVNAFLDSGNLKSTGYIQQLDAEGARVV
jgi:homoserine kinase